MCVRIACGLVNGSVCRIRVDIQIVGFEHLLLAMIKKTIECVKKLEEPLIPEVFHHCKLPFQNVLVIIPYNVPQHRNTRGSWII